MNRPATRLLGLLELLQGHERLSGTEMARRLGVHVRTIRRYVDHLEEMGVPVTTERGRDGGYMLVAGFKIPPMMFTADEALALSIGLLASRGLGLAGAAAASASAQAKLERVLPESLRRRARAVGETVKLDLAVSASPAREEILAALCAAALSRRRVHLSYRSVSGAVSERDFDPYGLACRGGRWYAAGWCHLRRGMRTFRLDRIDSVKAGEQSFSPPSGFDPLEYLVRSVAALPRRHAIEVLLETDMATARRELFSAFGLLETAEGGVRLRSQADDLGWFAAELARLPFAFRIRKPRALSAALRAHAAALLRTASAPTPGKA